MAKKKRKRRSRKNNYSKHITIVIGALCIVAIAILIKVISIFVDYNKSENLYNQTKAEYVIINDIGDTEDESQVEEPIEPETEDINEVWEDMISVDIKGLKEQNADIVGWIYMENEDTISYPILLGKDNDAYIHTTFDKKSATAGSIFMDASNQRDMSDLNTIIYGHNMRNLSMFGKLRYFKRDAEYVNEHRYFQIIIEHKKYRYEIFAYKDISANSEIYANNPTDRTVFPEYVQRNFINGSLYNSGIEIGMNDQIVTLSTCNGNDEQRFVVCGKLIATSNW